VKLTDWEAFRQLDGAFEVFINFDNGDREHIILRIPSDLKPELCEEYIRGAVLSVAHHKATVAPVLSVTVETVEQADRAKPVAPPAFAELVMSLLAPKNSAQAQLGDLQEIFEANVDRLGERQARRKYWMQVAASLRPLLVLWVKRLGLVTLFLDYMRSKLGL